MKFIYVASGFALVLWFFDAFISYMFFPEKDLISHIFMPNSYNLIKRMESILLLFGLGLYAQSLMNKLLEREEKLKKLVERQKSISKLGYIALSEDIKKLMQKAVMQIEEVLNANHVGIFIPCKEDKYVLECSVGFLKEDIFNLEIPANTPTSITEAEIKKFGKNWQKYKIKSGINIPIKGKNCFGILGVYFDREKFLDEGEISFLKAVSALLTEACEIHINKESLMESENRYKQLVELSPDAIIVHNKGKIIFANSATLKMFKATKPEDIVGKDVLSFVHPEYISLVKKRIAYQQRTGKPVPLYEEKLVRLDGEVFFAEVAATPIIFDGKPSSLVMVREITERKKQEEKIRRLNHVHAVLSNINSAIIRIRDKGELLREACRIAVEEGRLLFAWISVNKRGCLEPYIFFGKEEGFIEKIVNLKKKGVHIPELSEENLFICNDIYNSEMAEEWKEEALKRGYKSMLSIPVYVRNEFVYKCNFYSDTIDFFDSDEIKLFEEMIADLSLAIDYIDKEGEIFKLTYYDSLTELPNRYMLKNLINHALPRIRRAGRLLAIVCLDIDDFKKINDSMGHSFGDKLLQAIAERLKNLVREGDVVARMSGDEFCLMLSDIAQLDDISLIIFKLMEEFSKPVQVGDREVYITISAGISVFPTDGEDEETLLKNATVALHDAKKETGNSYNFFTKEIDERATREYLLELELRHALDRNELYLNYQPIIDINTKRVVGVEALVRWQSSSIGFVSPGEFIPIAERTGLIVNIGEWILQESIKQLSEWNEKGIGPFRMAINISAKQILKKDFVPNLLKMIESYKIQPEQIELELTETEFIERSEVTLNALNEIRMYGIRVAIDDFGTGYSSLGYLINFPVDIIKIDIIFTRQMIDRKEYASVVKTIINMAHSMNMDVIAEGIESEAQLEFLRRNGCKYAQGYLFSPPVDPRKIEEMFNVQED